MARKRLVSPGFFTHAELYDAEASAGLPLRLAFAGLWTASDRRGIFAWQPRVLKLAILPYDTVDFEAVLRALQTAGFIAHYVVDGKEFGRIPSFGRWQTFHPHEKASDLPDPLESAAEPTNVGLGSDIVRTDPSVTASTTVAVASTGTGTGTDRVVVDKGVACEEFEPGAVHELTALNIVIWSNSAVEEKWGPQSMKRTYTLGQAAAVFEALNAIGIEGTVLRASIFRQCRESPRDTPPNSPAYFVPGAKLEWAATLAQRAVAASGERPPPATAPIGREHWADKKAREEREEGERRLARDRWGNVELRRGDPDGDAWWERMQREAKAAGLNPILYAFDRMNESAGEPKRQKVKA